MPKSLVAKIRSCFWMGLLSAVFGCQTILSEKNSGTDTDFPNIEDPIARDSNPSLSDGDGFEFVLSGRTLPMAHVWSFDSHAVPIDPELSMQAAPDAKSNRSGFFEASIRHNHSFNLLLNLATPMGLQVGCVDSLLPAGNKGISAGTVSLVPEASLRGELRDLQLAGFQGLGLKVAYWMGQAGSPHFTRVAADGSFLLGGQCQGHRNIAILRRVQDSLGFPMADHRFYFRSCSLLPGETRDMGTLELPVNTADSTWLPPPACTD